MNLEWQKMRSQERPSGNDILLVVLAIVLLVVGMSFDGCQRDGSGKMKPAYPVQGAGK